MRPSSKPTDPDSLLRLHYISRLMGMAFGVVIALAGVWLMLRGLSGAVNWNLKIPGLSSSLSNASPGVLMLICGTIVLLWFRPSSKIEQDINLNKKTAKQKVSLFKDAGQIPTPAPLALGSAVQFPDRNIEIAIREQLKKPSGDLFELELSVLTSLNLNSRDISNLQGIQFCRNLRILAAEYNRIADITPLLELHQLEILSLNGNPLTPLSEADGADLSCLEFLHNLKELYIGKTGTKHIDVLARLTNLQRLVICYNLIEDIGPLVENVEHGGLRAGSFVDLSMNPLVELSRTKHLPFLRSRGIEVAFTSKSDIDRFAAGLRSRTLDEEQS